MIAGHSLEDDGDDQRVATGAMTTVRKFAPFEEPEVYAAELRDFFRPYRKAA